MTVSTQVSRNEYTGNGATTQYDFTFRILDKSHLLVQTLDTSESIVTLILGTDYTVTGVNRYNGGKVVLTSALPAGYKISIERSTPVTQESSIRNQGGFFPEIHEDALDKLTMLVQQAYGWWSGLSLRKPSWLANYYDALNNRIRNLRDPSQAQDAATKSYVDNSDIDLQQQITSNLNRSLRVPDSYISQLPSAQDRAWKGLGFDGAGQPKLQDPAGTGLWGYVPAIGSFEQGSLLTQRFEVLLWESTDEYWRWDGVMPKVVLPGSTPATAGGTGKGKWIDVTDATLRSNLGSGEGAMKVYRNASPLARIIRSSIFEYLTEADQQALLTIPGVNVIADYALKKAIADGVMVLDIPWNVGALNFGLDPAMLPLGFQFIGWGCRRPYTIDDDNSFLNCGVVIRVAAGASFPFYSTGRHVFRDIVFDGRDKTTYLFYSPNTATQFNGTRLEGCGFYRFAIGIGWASGGAARYIGTMKAYFCSISGNGDGVRNLIDSMMFGCTINANDRGVALTGGANNNFFGGCRNEWNTGDNWYAYQSVENQIFGELCDRAGRGGVVAGAKSSWILNGVNVRRSGANQPVGNDYSANFIIIDDGKIELSGVRTGVGANDSGDGGTISPSYNVSALGSGGGTLLVSGSDMTGFVTSAINQKATTLNKSVTGNLGMDDDVN
ncbi:TPA: phage tail protein, partial [Klebsiella pneumoniae]|nr:phage tail protein [Klebsiella pneumoniae]